MSRPCVRCRQEFRPADIDTGARCSTCVINMFDRAMDTLLAGQKPMSWWRRLRQQVTR